MAKNEIAMWAQEMLDSNCLILDTETTGLYDGEIVQIAVINTRGEALMDRLVKPVRPIPAGATAIHGITDADVECAVSWAVVSEELEKLITGCNLVVYNATYDRKMMHQSAEKAGLPKVEWKEVCNWHCAMQAYAEFYGDWNDWHQSYRWQRLTDACSQMGVPEPNAPAHSALGDCLRTLALLKKMAAWQPAPEA